MGRYPTLAPDRVSQYGLARVVILLVTLRNFRVSQNSSFVITNRKWYVSWYIMK